ncbi:MAG: Uma2 family endonuclease, partial [Anaerolineae bacterium]|nr:Uma2 family endonuclease [Anaerolineae bacterium]
MSANPQHAHWTVDEYLAMERDSDIKHEFINGEIFAIAGASREHTLITGNTLTLLNQQLQDTACEVYGSDMRVRVSPTRYTYPDLSLVCDTPQFTDDKPGSLLNPLLIIEVLSESTEQKDRTIKFRDYRKLASLQGYILILQDTPHIELYSRQ